MDDEPTARQRAVSLRLAGRPVKQIWYRFFGRDS